jgi:hypothetical protein
MWMTKDAPFLYTKRGVYYFSRRVPEDLRGHYKSHRVAFSLRTKSQNVARARSISLAAKLDEDWLTLRWKNSDKPFLRFHHVRHASDTGAVSSGVTFTDAKELYVKSKKGGRSSTFEQGASRCSDYLVGCVGDKAVESYTRSEVNLFRDTLVERGLSKASVRRMLISTEK